MKQDSIVDHAVCIDASRGVIFDSEEDLPVKLSVRDLILCEGDTETRI